MILTQCHFHLGYFYQEVKENNLVCKIKFDAPLDLVHVLDTLASIEINWDSFRRMQHDTATILPSYQQLHQYRFIDGELNLWANLYLFFYSRSQYYAQNAKIPHLKLHRFPLVVGGR